LVIEFVLKFIFFFVLFHFNIPYHQPRGMLSGHFVKTITFY
ncbi:uncharacterized protein METZ01_LOCUS271138, partial [marine metagenome]